MTGAGSSDGQAPRDGRLDSAEAHEEGGRPVEALREAWAALDLDSGDAEAKSLIARVLRNHPGSAPPERREGLERLLLDPAVEPSVVARAAWHLLLADGQPLAA